MGLAERLYELLTRVLSLRVIVIVAALSVVALVITLGAWVWFGVTNDQYSQLDRRLDSVSSLGDISTLLRSAQQAEPDQPVPDGGLVRTARIDDTTVSIPRDVVLPQFDVGYANTTIDGVEYRVRTFAAGDAMIALGAPLAETQRRIDELHRRVLVDLRRRHHRHGPGRLGDVVDHDQSVPSAGAAGPRHQRAVQSR